MIMTEERREQLQNMLQVVETAIIELVSNKVASYKIGERFFTYHTIDDLLKLKKDIYTFYTYFLFSYFCFPVFNIFCIK